ncbi:hypothetical protein KIPB_013011, partial [Kipferlia bialata]
ISGFPAAYDYEYIGSMMLGFLVAFATVFGLIILTVKVIIPRRLARVAVSVIPDNMRSKILLPDVQSGIYVNEVAAAAPADASVMAYGRFDEKYNEGSVAAIGENLAAAGTDMSKVTVYQGHPFLYPTVASDSVSSIFWSTKDKYGLDTLIRAANEFHRVLP